MVKMMMKTCENKEHKMEQSKMKTIIKEKDKDKKIVKEKWHNGIQKNRKGLRERKLMEEMTMGVSRHLEWWMVPR